jgi:hypothetical protein
MPVLLTPTQTTCRLCGRSVELFLPLERKEEAPAAPTPSEVFGIRFTGEGASPEIPAGTEPVDEGYCPPAFQQLVECPHCGDLVMLGVTTELDEWVLRKATEGEISGIREPAEAPQPETDTREEPDSSSPPPADQEPAGDAEASGTPNMVPGFADMVAGEQLLRMEQSARECALVSYGGLRVSYDREDGAYTYEDSRGNQPSREEALALLEEAAARRAEA